MPATRTGPFHKKGREVLDVECDQDSALSRGKFQQVRIIQPLQIALTVNGTHIVTRARKPRADPLAGNMRVEEDPQFQTSYVMTG